ncbi:MAG: hypothetical protein FWD47_14210 [Treponema sp.]|nr:hypothetical protein [Treponema sp.]
MALIDTYRNNMNRKREELSKLSQDKSNLSAKIPPLNSKIISAKKAVSQTKSSSTIQSKLREIEQAHKSLADIDKKIADIDKKYSSKEKEFINEEKRFKLEEEKVNKKRLQDNERQLRTITQSLQYQDYMQRHLSAEINMLKKVPEKITVLFFATNPKDTSRLRLDEEVRSIQEMIRKSEHRDSISFESRWAVRSFDILQAINELNPDVIHFSGHGAASTELILENTDGSAKYIPKETITQTIMTSSDKIHLIIFNTCFSDEQAQLVKEHVDAAIGMVTSISDLGACIFSAQFYSSLGFGLTLKKAFDQAIAALALDNPNDHNTPVLYVRDGIDPDNMYIVKPKKDML